MGGAMLAGWIESGVKADDILVLDPKPSQKMVDYLNDLEIELISTPVLDYEAKLFLLAVKPQLMEAVLPQLLPMVKSDSVAVSVAAGTTIDKIQSFLGDIAIVRAMPNTPALLRKGMTVGFANVKVTPTQRDQVESLLSAIGEYGWVEREADIDGVTAVSGSGPAYVFYLAECMAKAGEKAGLSAELSEQLARVTIAGAGEMLNQSELPASQLRENVTSPNGTTAAALSVLMDDAGLMQLMEEAILKAKMRSEELS